PKQVARTEAPKPPLPDATPAPRRAAPAPTPETSAPLQPALPERQAIPPAVEEPRQRAAKAPAPPPLPPVTEQEDPRVKSRQEAFDRAARQADEDAIRLDATDGAPRPDARQLEARNLAGMGYRLSEARSVAGSEFDSSREPTLAECANTCT